MQNLMLSNAASPTELLGAAVSPLDMSLAVDNIATMFMKEFGVKDAILNDLRLNLPSETLAVYLTTWRVRPHIEELFIEIFKEKLKLYDQITSSR